MKGGAQPPTISSRGRPFFQHTRVNVELLPENVSVPLVFSVILHDIAKTADSNGGWRTAASVSTSMIASARK